MTEKYLLLKRGLYACPEHLGYTAYKSDAGRYPEEVAKKHVDWHKDFSMAMLEDDAPEIAPGAREYQKTEFWENSWKQARVELECVRAAFEDHKELANHNMWCLIGFSGLAALGYLTMTIAYILKG